MRLQRGPIKGDLPVLHDPLLLHSVLVSSCEHTAMVRVSPRARLHACLRTTGAALVQHPFWGAHQGAQVNTVCGPPLCTGAANATVRTTEVRAGASAISCDTCALRLNPKAAVLHHTHPPHMSPCRCACPMVVASVAPAQSMLRALPSPSSCCWADHLRTLQSSSSGRGSFSCCMSIAVTDSAFLPSPGRVSTCELGFTTLRLPK